MDSRHSARLHLRHQVVDGFSGRMVPVGQLDLPDWSAPRSSPGSG
jgi:hypothetical protein